MRYPCSIVCFVAICVGFGSSPIMAQPMSVSLTPAEPYLPETQVSGTLNLAGSRRLHETSEKWDRRAIQTLIDRCSPTHRGP